MTCQTLDSHTFLIASASADPLTFSSTNLLMSSNLYHIQDNALGMPADLSALLMAASCFSQVKICWNPCRYLFASNALNSQCIYKISAVLMMAFVGRRQRMAGKGASCDVKPFDLCHGSFHPPWLIETVQLLLEGTYSQKIQVL